VEAVGEKSGLVVNEVVVVEVVVMESMRGSVTNCVLFDRVFIKGHCICDESALNASIAGAVTDGREGFGLTQVFSNLSNRSEEVSISATGAILTKGEREDCYCIIHPILNKT
jgi:hypothetical protein